MGNRNWRGTMPHDALTQVPLGFCTLDNDNHLKFHHSDAREHTSVCVTWSYSELMHKQISANVHFYVVGKLPGALGSSAGRYSSGETLVSHRAVHRGAARQARLGFGVPFAVLVRLKLLPLLLFLRRSDTFKEAHPVHYKHQHSEQQQACQNRQDDHPHGHRHGRRLDAPGDGGGD